MTPTSPDTSRPRVAFFITCMVDTLYPGIGLAATELLQEHGAEVVCPDAQTCCGQPAFNAGYRREARSMARHFLDVFWPLIESDAVDAIVAPGGSCIAMVRNHYPLLFDDREDEEYLHRALQVAARAYELTQYLVDVLGARDAAARFTGKLAYHPCCHLLRELGVDDQPRRLLAGLDGAERVEPPGSSECCGFGGLFAVKNAAISTAIGRRKARHLEESGADLVVLNDAGCMAHLNGILRRENHHCRAVHIAELLAGRLDRPDADASS